jgi:hypothetical protein
MEMANSKSNIDNEVIDPSNYETSNDYMKNIDHSRQNEFKN